MVNSLHNFLIVKLNFSGVQSLILQRRTGGLHNYATHKGVALR